jgi:hypothetical protein
LTALHFRVEIAKRTPYVDLSIWGPYGRKTYKKNKFRNWVPDGTGGYDSMEIPGPESYQIWLVGWRVFSTACIMLKVVSSAALEAYEARMEKLVRLWPDAWHLVYTSDDHMRAEQLERIRRSAMARGKSGHPLPPDFTEEKPWSAVFILAAEDTTYWDEHVTGPAQAWRTSGKRGSAVTYEELTTSPLGRTSQSSLDYATSGPATSASRKRPRPPKWERDLAKSRSSQDPPTQGKGGKGGKGNKGGKSGKSAKDSGKERSSQPCWSFSKGFGTCKEAAPNSTCPEGRAHICHLCKGAHQASSCRQ